MSRLLEGLFSPASRIAFLGVGSELRADDIVGLLVADRLEKTFKGWDDILVLKGCSAPENMTGPILAFEPSHLVVIDCAELDSAPGTARLFPIEAIGGVSSNTHSFPLSVIFGYIRQSWPCEILVIGIQPASLAFDGKPTKELLSAARRVAREVTLSVEESRRP